MWVLKTSKTTVAGDYIVVSDPTIVREKCTGIPTAFIKDPPLYSSRAFLGTTRVGHLEKASKALSLGYVYANNNPYFYRLVSVMRSRDESKVVQTMCRLYDIWMRMGKPQGAAMGWLHIILRPGRLIRAMNKYLRLSEKLVGEVRCMAPAQFQIVGRRSGIPICVPCVNTPILGERAATVIRTSLKALTETEITPEVETLLPRVQEESDGSTAESLTLLPATDMFLEEL